MTQTSFFKPESDWRPTEHFPSLAKYPEIGLDLETNDPNIKVRGSGWPMHDGFVVGISLTTADFSHYYPIRHPEDNLDCQKVLTWLRQEAASYTGLIVGANLAYDLGWLLTDDVSFPLAKFFDVQYAEALLDESADSYSLNNISKRYGIGEKDETLLDQAAKAYGVDRKGGMWRLPARFVGPYGEQDTKLPMQLMQLQRPKLAEQGLQKISDLEHSILPILVKMRRRGVRVDLDRAERTKLDFRTKEQQSRLELKQLVGFEVDVWSNGGVAKAFDKAGVVYPRTRLGQPSFVAAWLNSQEHPVAKHVLRIRKYDKAVGTFIDSMVFGHQSEGRVYPEFHPLRTDRDDDGGRTGTVSGRFSGTNPNLQQVPARDPEIGPAIRSLFLPEENEQWAAVDYSQQEPRLTVHYAALLGLPGGQKACNIFAEDPETDYHQMVADITGLSRKHAKAVNLGLAYGMGGAKLCTAYLNLPVETRTDRSGRTYQVAGLEGQAIIDQYHSRLPYLKQLTQQTMDTASARGYITTIGGRRCRFDLWEPIGFGRGKALPYEQAKKAYGASIKRAFTHKALNRLIQGGSADMIKYSLVELDRAGLLPLVTVHDENGLSVADKSEAFRAAKIMSECMELRLPLKVDVDFGPSWGEAKKIKEDA